MGKLEKFFKISSLVVGVPILAGTIVICLGFCVVEVILSSANLDSYR